MEKTDGLMVIGYTGKGRWGRLTDRWFRIKFFLSEVAFQLRSQRRPFRLMSSLRAAYTMSLIFDMNLRQSIAARRNK